MSQPNHQHQEKNKRVLFWAFVLTMGFALLEVATGLVLESLALFGEGIHMSSDGLSLLMGFVAVTVGMRAATRNKPFGFRRIETITAFLNGLALMLIPLFIVYEAVQRFISPREIEGSSMLTIAAIGLVINLIVAFMLFRADQSSLNIRAAALHVLSDLLSSVSTITAALLIMGFGWYIADPIVSIAVSITIFLGGYKITKEAFHCLMEGTPPEVDPDVLKEAFLAVSGVVEITDLKTWAIASEVNHLTARVRISGDAAADLVLAELKEICQNQQLDATIQLDRA